jgi:Mg-chelatase subunit ChlD
MVFSSHTELLQKFTTDRALAAQAIAKASGMQSKDGTFIHESMYEAVNQAMQSTTPGSRRVMIWLTDGTANFENSLTVKTIGYKPSMAKPEGTYCKLQLKLAPEALKARADLRMLRVRTRQGYYR